MKAKKYSKKNQEKLKAYLQNNKVDDLKSVCKNSAAVRGRPQNNPHNVERGGDGQVSGS